MFPSPSSLIKGDTEIPQAESVGTISLEELHKHDCNADRRLLCLFGTVFDVTSSEKGYGKDGAYKEYAGHDITLAIGLMKTDSQWLDRFVKMEDKWKKDAEGWLEYMEAKYPKVGKLDKWDEDPDTWPELSEEEKEALNKCIIM
ncbi:cytochrome b5-like heme/steroid binding domain containing protein [Nitzschia inconspicua]|uniref:Cytochrome b5-like heme/steroid binding domain containing protein n=1 Tax=Nitzschia inconspicua TaxID=303405 RepID=A0A9K3KDM4_9STRA|nr:cytochrome b5-like heme/steroid binding domain containing protein [Nitzschia inconspicua]